jgi:hypothetical protein
VTHQLIRAILLAKKDGRKLHQRLLRIAVQECWRPTPATGRAVKAQGETGRQLSEWKSKPAARREDELPIFAIRTKREHLTLRIASMTQ